jgi:hypothetical protein
MSIKGGQTMNEQQTTREKIKLLINCGLSTELKQLCKEDERALDILIMEAMKMRDTLNHIKGII